MTEFFTPSDLAEMFSVPEPQILEWRRVYRWPSIKFGKTIRFTREQVAEIVASHSAKTQVGIAQPVALAGQTRRSARRSS